MEAVNENTREEICQSYDWEEVFGEGCGGNCDGTVESLDNTECSSVRRDDIEEVIASVNGENDGDEWIGVFRMNDGRYLVAVGSCDYTGWDCQAGNHLSVAGSLETAIALGLTPWQATRLGLKHPGHEQEAQQ